jgi:lipoteichoic acid synthase
LIRKSAYRRQSVKNVLQSAMAAEIFYILLILAALMLKFFYFQFTTRLNVRPFITRTNFYMLVSSFGVLLLISSVLLILFNKRRKKAFMYLNIFLTVLIICDTLYFRYYYNAITIPVLHQIGLVGSVGDSVLNLIKAKDIVYIIDFPILIAYTAVMKKKFNPELYKIKLLKRVIIAAVIFAVGFFAFQNSYQKSSRDIFPYDNNYVIRELGIVYFHYYDTKRYIKENFLTDRKLTEEERAIVSDYFKNKEKGGENLRGTAKGKNLIIVQMEAIQEFLINRKLNGKEITPNLNKFINDSVYFDNFYYQVGGGNTADAELLCNTSLYPVRDGAVYFRYPSNTYYSLPKALKNEGYDTYVFHANNASFWNRSVMYKALGFDNYFNNQHYQLDEVLGWGLSDASFFRQSLEKIDTGRPFYGFFVTLSSHHPYNYFKDYTAFDPGEYEGTFFGNYLKAAHYVDHAVGQFLELLKEKDLYENSIIVIYGDHSGVQKDQIETLKNFLGKDLEEPGWTLIQKVPCFIRYPGITDKGVNSIIGGEVDLLPTIANLMGIDYPYAIGRDLFNTKRSYSALRNGSVVTDKYIYATSTEQVYSYDGQILNKEDYIDDIKSLQHQVNVSDIIIRKNAFKKNP